MDITHTIAHMHHYIGHFPGKLGLAGCLVDSQSLVVLILSSLKGLAKTSYSQHTLD